MKVHRQRRGAKAYFGSSLVAQACALLRYVLLARLLGPEQLGLAMTLILTIQFFESVSDSGSDRFLIQDRDGDAPQAQGLVHLLAIGRGIFIAACLIVFSLPLAQFFNQPGLAGSFVVLAIVPVIGGFLHFDLRRMQRHNDFSIEASVMLWGEICCLAVTAVAAVLTRDFTAVIWGMTARSLAMVATSWWKSERRYSVRYSTRDAPRLARFALPLMANGLLLFFTAQGDRLLIGNQLGVTELGHYSAILLLIYYPSQVLSRFIQALHLPLVAATRDDPAQRSARIGELATQGSLLAIALAAGFAICAPLAVPLLYGEEFRQPVLLIALVGIIQASRFLRLLPTTTALGAGRTAVVLGNNLIRLIVFPTAFLGLMAMGGLVGLAIGFMIGELASLILAVALSNRAARLNWSANMGRICGFIVCCAAVMGTAWLLPTGGLPVVFAALGTALLLLAILISERRMIAAAIAMARP